VGKPEGKKPLGRPRSRWENNIKIGSQEVGCGVWTGSSWLGIGTGWGELVIAVMILRVPTMRGNS